MIDIDLVYLWVNGNDPKWLEKRNAYMGIATQKDSSCKGRFADNDELKYSLRSVEKYAPWIRKIFIVTDNQVPEWLDTTNPKIQIVDHTEIIPKQYLPCFSSRILEHHLPNIPGLSEHFLFANDDMLINKPVTPETFFADDSLPIIRMNRRPLGKLLALYRTKILRKPLNTYQQGIRNSALLVERRYGIFYKCRGHHNIDSYLKSTYQHIFDEFRKEIEPTLSNSMRTPFDYQRNLYSYAALAEKRAHLEYVDQHTSFRLHIDKRHLFRKFERYNPLFFCVNDSEYADDEDRKYTTAFLQRLFPDKSKFEK